MNSQYINQHNQNTVETVTAMTNKFFKWKSKKKNKHMHTKVVVVVVVKIFVCLPEILCSRQDNKCQVEPVCEPTHTVLWQVQTSQD